MNIILQERIGPEIAGGGYTDKRIAVFAQAAVIARKFVETLQSEGVPRPNATFHYDGGETIIVKVYGEKAYKD